MFVASAMVGVLAGCGGLDALPILTQDSDEFCAPAREATVACVRDGDTIELGECGGEAVRLLGINAPEIAHASDEVDECFGPEATDWLTDRLLGADIRLEFDKICEDTYGRTLAYVWATDEDGADVLIDQEIVREGYARVYEEFDDIRLANRLYAAQGEAQAANAGLWAVCE